MTIVLLLLGCNGQLITLGQAPSSAAAGASAQGGVPADAGSASGAAGSGESTGGAEGNAGSAGSAGTQEPLFDPPVLLDALASDYEDDNPTLTSDLLEIYFTSTRAGGPGNADVWTARRASPDDPFDAPEPVVEASTDQFDSSPAVEGDGLTLWVAQSRSDGIGGLDIWRLNRPARGDAWQAPELVPELSSALDDIPRPTGNHGLTMPLGSRRAGGMYLSYLATRPSVTSAFGEPVLISELVTDGSNTADAFLTADGLTLFFAQAISGSGDLYVAQRADTSSGFESQLALSTINTSADDRDPWLSPDGTRLYFSSDRDGTLNIYEARRQTE